jgi:hypothetical protein
MLLIQTTPPRRPTAPPLGGAPHSLGTSGLEDIVNLVNRPYVNSFEGVF